MDIRKLQRAIVDGLEDVKAQQITVFNTEHLSALFERVIIASGTSNRQTKALAASVRDSVRAHGMQVMATEGEENGEWIIVDCGAAVAHIMQPAIREYYHLEEIWGGKSVRMKMGAVDGKLVKASQPGKASAKRPPARPMASGASPSIAKYATKSATKPAGKAAARPAAKPAPRAAAKSITQAKPAARRSPPAGSARGKSGVKVIVTTASKAASKTGAPAKKAAAARKSAPRKTAAAGRGSVKPATRR
jgi:ribosome-associated protein